MEQHRDSLLPTYFHPSDTDKQPFADISPAASLHSTLYFLKDTETGALQSWGCSKANQSRPQE